MAVSAINHVTFAVSDLQRSIDFYVTGLGLPIQKVWNSGAYLGNDQLWICLTHDPKTIREKRDDYTHVAFTVDGQNEFVETISALQKVGAIEWKENTSEGESYYFRDPDGHKLEIHMGNLSTRLSHMMDDIQSYQVSNGGCHAN